MLMEHLHEVWVDHFGAFIVGAVPPTRDDMEGLDGWECGGPTPCFR